MKQLLKICKFSQNELKKYVATELKNSGYNPISKNGFIYASGTIPVLLVAHMDTVHRQLPSTIMVNKNKISSPQGIGGDDRCGVWLILNAVKKLNCHVLFTEDEEIGGIGATKFTKSGIKPDVNFIVEYDRKGKNDAVFYNCGNDEFIKAITSDFYVENYGSFSDISIIAPFFDIAAVNLSCGYYNAHTINEFIMFNELKQALKKSIELINRLKDTKYNYQQHKTNDFYWYFNDSDGVAYEIDYYSPTYSEERFELIYADTYEDALLKFLIEHDNVCYKDIIDVYQIM